MKLNEKTFITPEFTNEEMNALRILQSAFGELTDEIDDGKIIDEEPRGYSASELYDYLNAIEVFMEYYYKDKE